jgi:hypothetical protein
MRVARSILVPLVLLGAAVSMPNTTAAQKKERDRISREELVQAADKFQDLYTAIRGLRPHFLTVPRGPRSTDIQPTGNRGSPLPGFSGGQEMRGSGGAATPPIILYIDDAKAGDLDQLKGIPTINVEEVSYMNPSKAGAEFGLGHEGGAILVKRYKGTKPPGS